ncbi:protein canopy 4 [Ischnura elegans]|uniref:protein canopy 4 n=1 Tax=Ischnura elegans TaxID=197161 RepID=UPI001ED8987A|nr:protein canopy 4 [Ischnura elegans]
MKAFFLIIVCLTIHLCKCGPEEEEGVKYADKCEVCKVVAIELESRLQETGKSHEVLEIGYSLDSDKNKKRTKYEKSELRLVESLDGVCERILEYNIHKERGDSTRFAKGMSQTFKTLHGLVDKGVKVELGIPLELWDKPSVEITNMKSQCEKLIEDYESDIEDWYFHHQGESSLTTYLCTNRALKDYTDKCLDERLPATKEKNKSDSKNNRKGDQQSLKEDL